MTMWATVPLAEAAEIRGGATPRRGNTEYWNGDIPWLTPTDLPPVGAGITNVQETGDSITQKGLGSCSASLLPRGAVFFSSRASIGKVGIADVPLATNQGFTNFIPRDGVETRYLAWCLSHHARQIARLAGSTTFKEVTKRSLRRFPIPLPPPPEQRRIVEILDEVDRLRQLRSEADDKLERVLQALFLEMFGDPITNPNGWPIRRFDEICESRLGKMLDAKQQTGFHSRRYLRNANVYWDRLALDDLLQMDFNEEDRHEFRLKPGDVLICEGGEVGRAAIWNDELAECYYQKALHRARPFPHASAPEFIVYVLWELARRGALREAASGATFSHLTGVKLKALRIPVPPLDLQQLFGQRVRLFKKNDGRSASAARLDRLFKTMCHHAFSGRLTARWRRTGRQETLSKLPAFSAESRR